MNTRAGRGAIGPELLILDEPTNGLDPAGTVEMRTLLRRLGAGGHTVLVSGHPLGEVQVCDRVGVIAQGRLLRQATVGELRGHGSLRVVAEPLHQARTVAERLFGQERVRVHDATLHLDVDDDQAPRVNRELVLAGVAVRYLGWHERSLEEVFELTVSTDGGTW
jgi:ABC-2 type transport system ATP-binding protein